MSLPKKFKIKESEIEIKKLLKHSNAMIAKRLQALLLFKRHQDDGISKRDVAQVIGVNHNSIQTWRAAYIAGGIKSLMEHSNIGYKPTKITKMQEKVLGKQLNDPSNGMVGFTELLDWFNDRFKTQINYKTFHGFVVRKFNAKIKVARKVHLKKDLEAVEAFKKTSNNFAKTSSLPKQKNTKK